MSIASLANIPGNWPTLQSWTFAHMDHHRQINNAIKLKFGTSLVLFPIDPVDPANPLSMGAFLYQHQQMHNAQNQILGIDGLPLIDVDWKNDAQRSTWIFQNFTEHRQASQILGIG